MHDDMETTTEAELGFALFILIKRLQVCVIYTYFYLMETS